MDLVEQKAIDSGAGLVAILSDAPLRAHKQLEIFGVLVVWTTHVARIKASEGAGSGISRAQGLLVTGAEDATHGNAELGPVASIGRAPAGLKKKPIGLR
ncbi:hypothetical protein D3C79_597510 [compost metagenome]